jgi:hypothetical protein
MKANKEPIVVPKLNTKQVTEALLNSLDPRQYAAFTEVSTISGKKLDQGVRFMDVWAIKYWGMTESICYEVKISKSDFFHEISKPLKRRDGLRFSNLYAFVTPAGLLDPAVIPPEAGLIEVSEDYSLKTIIKSPWRDIPPLPRNFMAVILRKLDKERLHEYLKTIGDDELNEAVGNVMLEIVDKHREAWQSVNKGDKTIPDKIADAMKDLKSDILRELVARKIYR